MTQEEITAAIEAERAALVAETTRKALATFWARAFPVAEAADDTSPLPPEADRLQADVADRLLPYDIVRQAMSMISLLGVTFVTEDPEEALEALATCMVHASVICTIERLSVVPVIELGAAFAQRQDVQPARASAALARAVLSIRSRLNTMNDPYRMRGVHAVAIEHDYRLALVEAMALAIAKGLDDVAIQHDITVRPVELFAIRAREVKAGIAHGHASDWRRGEPRRRTKDEIAEAFTKLRAAIDSANVPGPIGMQPILHIEATIGTQAEVKITPIDEPGAFAHLAEPTALGALWTSELAAADADYTAKERALDEHGYGGKPPVDPSQIVGLYAATKTEHQTMRDLEDARSRAMDPCPLCGEAMSHSGVTDVWQCKNGHDHTGQKLAERPEPVSRVSRNFPPPRK